MDKFYDDKNAVSKDIQMIRVAEKSDINRIIELFTKYIDNSFFAELGKPFLRNIFEGLILSNYGVNFVFVIDSKIVGFISGTSNSIKLLKDILFKKVLIRSAMIFFRPFFKQSVKLKRLWESLLYINRRMSAPLKAEMLFIAVEPGSRSKGIATELINCTLVEMKKRGTEKVRVSTDQSNIEVNKLLQKMGFDFVKSHYLYGKKMCLYNRII